MLSILTHSNIIMMIGGKKKISEIAIKKTAPVRLIKCYVCNKLFNSQPQFAIHLEHHQSKLNRTSVEQLQRKTQESFRTKRQPSAITRTSSTKGQQVQKQEEEEEVRESSLPSKEELEEQEEKELEDALKESQILLEKIDFLTQITEEPEKVMPIAVEEDKEEQYSIDNQYLLYLQLANCHSDQEAQSLILRTNFEDQSFQNYQEQLKHLRNLLKMAINPDSITKINSITRNITQDVLQQLKNKYASSLSSIFKGQSANIEKEIITESRNIGQIRYCAICYAPIQASSQFMQSQLGSAYHKDCLGEQQ